jgi:4-methylaminobutanoate oxidase (formaldehyde-forming)
MHPALPSETKVVIVGGGIVGCSIAYHLAKFGWRDVLLLEQGRLGGGTTWHAAGLVGRLRTSNSMTRINKYSAELYAGLEKETGHPVGWKQVGSLIVAQSEERLVQLRRTAALSELFGVEVLISSQAAQEKFPLLRTDDLRGAAWLPHDGKVLPKETALALAAGALSQGATIIESIRVLDVEHAGGRVTGVRTDRGPIRADYVVLAGGMWTRQLGLSLGVPIPLYPVEHHYVVSEPVAGASDELPVGRDPDRCIYFRGEGNAILLGAFQAHSKPWMVDRIPDPFTFQLLEPDWERFAEPLQAGRWRIPALEQARFARFVNGPEGFTPDNNFILGEAPQLRHLFVAAGVNSVGIASAGGAGKYLAEWLIEGRPTLDLWSVDIRRFGAAANNLSFLRERATEVLGLHYQMAWPYREYATGRGLRQSPLHGRLAACGACYGSKNGWERPNWFACAGMEPLMNYSFGRQNSFECSAREHHAARQAVALFDQTSFSKFLFKGRSVVDVLQRLCANDVDVAVGKVVYTALLNEGGGFESDLTVLRVDEHEYYLVSGTAQTVRDQDWITQHIHPNEDAALIDVTESFSVLGVMGPKARALLQRVSNANLANESFPFATAQTIDVGRATARALRLTYVGELGWELHVPTSQAVVLYETLMEAGQDLGLTNAGYYALDSLRLEKGYRAWGRELSPDDTPLEAGLAFAVAWDKPVEFLGRRALLRQKEAGVERRLLIFVLQDPEPVLWGGEPILRDGIVVGYTSSGAYGHSLGAAVAMGYVKCAAGETASSIAAGRYEISIAGDRYRARTYSRAPHDPERRRILS